MHHAPFILCIALVLTGMLSVYLSGLGFSRRNIDGAFEFGLFMISISLYIFGYAIELSHADLEGMLDAVKMEYTGIPYMSVFLVLFVYKFITGKRLNIPLTLTLLLIPVATTLLVFTVDYHSLFYIHPRVDSTGHFPVLAFEKGIFYNIRFVYQQLLTSGVIVYLFAHLFSVDKERRGQIILLVTCISLPAVAVIFYYFGFIPGHLDINPFVGAITGIGFWVAVFRFHLFELIPAARQLAVNAMQEGFLVIDGSGTVLDMNTSPSLVKTIPGLQTGKSLPSDSGFAVRLRESVSHDDSSFEYKVEMPSEESCYYKTMLYRIGGTRNRFDGVAILISDITESKKCLVQLQEQASLDMLTGIGNRRFLVEFGTREMKISYRNHTPIAFIMLDVDFFKKINDTFGHIAGDNVLVKIASLLKAGTRGIDLLGRYGGEEFLIICPNVERAGALILAERLRKNIEEAVIEAGDSRIRITASLGVYSCGISDPDASLSDAVGFADKALYLAKNEGRNCVRFAAE